MSLFTSMNTALTALHANGEALAIIGHNIANANTPGYTRQAPDLRALPLSPPGPAGGGTLAVAGGVAMAGVLRTRDQLADVEPLGGLARQGADQVLADAMDHLEGLLNEPSDAGLQAGLDRLFQSFADLANNPESTAVRATVRQEGAALAGTVRGLWQGLTAAAAAADAKIGAKVALVNTAASQVATYNHLITQAQAAGSGVADLLDQRDQVLDHLVALTGAQVVGQADGSVNVMLGGRLLVGAQGAVAITAAPGAGGVSTLQWPDGNPVKVSGGELSGLLTVRDQVVAGLQASLSDLTQALVTAVNATHAAGVGADGSTGTDFFDPASTPATLQLSTAVAGDLAKMAAARSTAPGDGAGALALSRLAQQPLLSGGTLVSAYQGMVGALGVQAQQAQRDLQADGLLVRQADALRQSSGGVSLDEEAAAMVRYQRSYEAAARFLSAMDELLDNLINRMH